MKRIAATLVSLTTLASVAFAGTVNPTPEPASMALMAAGLGGVAFVAWRKRRRS
jgi:hypothetical protein